jgi:hypothetical protein
MYPTISDYIRAKNTKKDRKYLIDFYKRVEIIKSKDGKIDLYNFGLKDNRRFWEEMYDDEPIPEEKCFPKKPQIGKLHQAEIPEKL